MFKPRSYEELCQAMKMKAPVEIDGLQGRIIGILDEGSTSGRIFIAVMRPMGGGKTEQRTFAE